MDAVSALEEGEFAEIAGPIPTLATGRTSNPFLSKVGMTWALKIDVLPAPDCAYTKTSWWLKISDTISSVSSSLPKNILWSCKSRLNERGPTKGFTILSLLLSILELYISQHRCWDYIWL